MFRKILSLKLPSSLSLRLSQGFSIIPDQEILKSIQKSGKISRILMTGGNGQLGTEILPYLYELYGTENILVTDNFPTVNHNCKKFEVVNVLDRSKVQSVVNSFKPNCIVHFAAILSASGERNPKLCLSVNVDGFKNMLDIACDQRIPMFSPSTIAAFGASTPKAGTPNTTIMRPSTVYGCTKVLNELLGTYYKNKYGMDFRSIRYPQVISCTEAFGGSGDYSIEIFYGALRNKAYTCYLHENTRMSFVYVDDLIKGTLKLIECDPKKLTDVVYNIQSCSFTVKEVFEEIRKHIPEFKMNHQIDFRQKIVDTWPESLDDTFAKRDWGYDPKFDIKELTNIMVKLVGEKVKIELQKKAK